MLTACPSRSNGRTCHRTMKSMTIRPFMNFMIFSVYPGKTCHCMLISLSALCDKPVTNQSMGN